MKRLRIHAVPAVVAIAALIVTAWVLRNESEASWVRLKAPAALARGQAILATVTLLEPADGLIVACDLHATSRVTPAMRIVAGGGAQVVTSTKNNYTFPLLVPGDPGVDQAHFVIYVGATRHWGDRQRAATSRRIRFDSPAGGDSGSIEIPVFSQVHDPGVVVPDHRVARVLTAGVWLVCSLLVAFRRSTVAPQTTATAWLWGGGFLVLAIWELSLAGPRISDWARSLAQDAHLYDDRRGFQRVITAFAVAGAGMLTAVLLSRSRGRLPVVVFAGVALSVVTMIASMLSLHEVDRVLAAPVFGVPAAALLRLVGAVTAAGGLCAATLRGAESAPSRTFM